MTISYKNTTKGSLIDVVLNKLALGNVELAEKRDLPLRIAQLAPGETRQITLHYENVPWKLPGDDSAQVAVLRDEQWAATVNGGHRKVSTRGVVVDVKLDDMKLTGHSTVIGPVNLDSAGVAALKRRRDAERKATSPDNNGVTPKVQAPASNVPAECQPK